MGSSLSTDLRTAAKRGDTAVVQELVQRGAKVNTCDEDGTTALMLAAIAGSKATVAVLLDAGAKPNLCKPTNRWTALMQASYHGHPEVVSTLLHHSADPDLQNAKGYTALTNAAFWGKRDIVSILLHAGARINIPTNHGKTAIDYARERQHPEIVHLLETPSRNPGECLQEPPGELCPPSATTPCSRGATHAVQTTSGGPFTSTLGETCTRAAVSRVPDSHGTQHVATPAAVEIAISNAPNSHGVVQASAPSGHAMKGKRRSGDQVISRQSSDAHTKLLATLRALPPVAFDDTKKCDVILSYRTDRIHGSGDGEGLAYCEGIARALHDAGHTPFHGHMVCGGDNWQQMWYGEMPFADVAIVMLSPAYFQSEACVRELCKICEQPRLNDCILPVYIGAVDLHANILGTSVPAQRRANFIRTTLSGNCIPDPREGFFQDQWDVNIRTLLARIAALQMSKAATPITPHAPTRAEFTPDATAAAPEFVTSQAYL
eukprot:m.535083 g.535083  ORF g.535083 m.535083 type:complete len:490 (-) comp22063_c0_seq3:135-1604(-)